MSVVKGVTEKRGRGRPKKNTSPEGISEKIEKMVETEKLEDHAVMEKTIQDRFMDAMEEPDILAVLNGDAVDTALPPPVNAAEPEKRKPGRPKKAKASEPPPATSSSVISSRLRRAYVKKIKMYYNYFPALQESVPPPRDMAQLSTEDCKNLAELLKEEQECVDPIPYLGQIVGTAATQCEQLAPLIGGLIGKPLNLSHPYSFGGSVDTVLKEPGPGRDAFNEIAIQYAGEISISPWWRLTMVMGQIAKSVSDANAQAGYKREPDSFTKSEEAFADLKSKKPKKKKNASKDNTAE